jgi:TetR/AcrR family transcriptional repressor of mexJK operon
VKNLKALAATPISSASGKQQEILKVASAWFLLHGFQGASINVMAREAGISKESFYRYYSSKEELFEAVIARELAEYRSRLQLLGTQPESLSLEAALTLAAETILTVVGSERTLALRRLVFREAEKSPEIGEYYYEIGPKAAYGHLQSIFRKHPEGAILKAPRLAQIFVALVLHQEMLKLECGVCRDRDSKRIKAHCRAVSKEFISTYYRTPK